MATIEQRVSALEAAHGNATAARLVLLAPHGLLTAEQQAQAAAARAAGHEVLVIELVPMKRDGNA